MEIPARIGAGVGVLRILVALEIVVLILVEGLLVFVPLAEAAVTDGHGGGQGHLGAADADHVELGARFGVEIRAAAQLMSTAREILAGTHGAQGYMGSPGRINPGGRFLGFTVMMAYSYDRRLAAVQHLDLAWVEKMRKDFLTLAKNLPRVKDYKTGLQLKEAFRVYRHNFNDLFFDNFLNRDFKYNIGLTEGDAKWFDKNLRTSGWSFSAELVVPIYQADEHNSPDTRFAAFEMELPKWKSRLQRRAQAFWKDIKEFIEYYERNQKKPIEVKMPTVENTTIEGIKLTMRGFENDDEHHVEELEKLREGLRLYRSRAARVAPILLQKQLPIICEFETKLDKGGEYDRGTQTITFYMSSLGGKGPAWAAHALAHEMGHHLFNTYLSEDAKTFWHQTIRGDFGDVDLQEVISKWPGDSWAFQFPEVMGKTDPILALQVDAITHDHAYEKLQTKEDFQKLLDSGQRTIRAPQHPVTGYGNKNPEEAFCETIGLLIAYGPQAVHERVRWWLDTVLPGKFRTASYAR